MHSRTRRILGSAAVLAILTATILSLALPALSDGPMYTRTERFGIAFVGQVPIGTGSDTVTQSLTDYDVAPFNVGWYSDWRYSATPNQPADQQLEYAQLLHVADGNWPPNWGAVENAAKLQPGAMWLIGNEPECPNQDAVTPTVYATRYAEAYQKIKGWDPTAQIAVGGMVQWTPLRQKWMEMAMAAYETQEGEAMPVDVWNIHIQILTEGNETNPNAGAGVPVGLDPQALGIPPMYYGLADCGNAMIFKSMIDSLRTWMADQGQQNKPLIISEMGVLQPWFYLVDGTDQADNKAYADHLVEQYMVEVFDYLLNETDATIGCPDDENRLVQRWLWFSLNGSFYDEATCWGGFNGSLYDYETKKLTQFGQRFHYYQYPESLKQMFVPFVQR